MSAIGSQFLALLAPSPAPGGTPVAEAVRDPFWQRFLTSAGFGGLMALAAALIAARIAALQLRHTKAQQSHERWWNTLTWVYDRAVVEKDKRVALPHHVTFALLTRLAERAQEPPADHVQQSAIKSILSMFAVSGNGHRANAEDDDARPEPAGGSVIPVTDPAAMNLLDDLRGRLSSDAELQARVDRLQYLVDVRSVIGTAAGELDADVDFSGGEDQHSYAAVRRDGREVLLQIRHSVVRLSNLAVLESIERLQTEIASSYAAIGGIIVVNRPVDRDAVDTFLVAKGALGVEVLTWTGAAENHLVSEALHRLLAPPHAAIRPGRTE